MIPLYKNNYIRVSGNASNFKVEIDPLKGPFSNYYIESCRAAEELNDLKQGKLHIMYSGGLDSEYCLKVFLSLGIDVTPVIIKLNPGYNDHDTKYAFDFCSAHNITPKVVDLDFDKFVESGKLLDVCKEMQSSTFGRASTGYVASLLDGTVIMGEGDPYMRLDQSDKTWYIEEREHYHATHRYFQKQGIHGTTMFICWSPEMMASFLSDPVMLELSNNELPGKLSNFSSRHIIYNRHSNFNLQVRPKFHGFEKIGKDEKFLKSKSFLALEEFGKSCNGFWRKRYHDFISDFIKQDN